MRHPTTTAREMLASGQWIKIGKGAYRHVSGVEIRRENSWWVIGDKRFAALWIARMAVENG